MTAALLFVLTDPGELPEPDFHAWYDHHAVLPRLAALDRRVYELIGCWGDRPHRPAPLLVCTSLSSTDPAALDAWYAAEHVPLLRSVPGWGRIRRYRLRAGDAPAFLAVHELDGPAALDHPAYRHAVSTPWRDRVMATVTARERRVFALHRTITA